MIIIFFFLLCHSTLASIYNDACTNNCDLLGLICLNNRCVCDGTSRLFWTSARCALCPLGWVMTETACLSFFDIPMTWDRAKSYCRSLQAELISLRTRDLIPLIKTAGIIRQIGIPPINVYTGWTSAHATEYSGLGIYEWLDNKVTSFTSQSDWWCKKMKPDLGYTYMFDDPTRQRNVNNEIEGCIAYRKSATTAGVACLDDIFCSQTLSFVCERSESTSLQYIGPPPNAAGAVATIAPARGSAIYTMPANGNGDIVHTVPSNVGTIIINTGDRATPGPIGGSKAKPIGTIVIGLFVCLLVLLLLLGGFFFFFKRSNKRQVQTKDSVSDTMSKDFTNSDTHTIDMDPVVENEPAPLPPITPIDIPKSHKTKQGGYSKQQFDEFE